MVKEHIETAWNHKYPHPSVAADIVALGFRLERTIESPDWRRQDDMRVSMVLIRRGHGEQKGMWALPGGFFLKSDANIEACARRELKEEANLTVKALSPLGNFSDIGRDNRGWVISLPYLAIINLSDMKNTFPKGGDDAAAAKWFDLKYSASREGDLDVLLQSDDGILIHFFAKAKDRSALGFEQPHFSIHYISGSSELAFDHCEIIATALANLSQPGERRMKSIAFLGEEFTLAQLRSVHDFIDGRTVPSIPQNFRRSVARFLEDTGRKWEDAGHRPAALYRWKGVRPE